MADKIILAGGNGYIGGAVAHLLRARGDEPIIVDNFSTSHQGALDGFRVVRAELAHSSECFQTLKGLGPVDAIIHFAALALVGESWQRPADYYRNNVLSSLNLADSAAQLGIAHFIHSSSCTVYGLPPKVPIDEKTTRQPISPYGDTKVISEMVLERFLPEGRALNLRYFNPAGSLPSVGWGEAHEPETHLLPRVIEAAIRGKSIPIFGKNYPTPDGTCIRDFIHIADLAEAHLVALNAKKQKRLPPAINIGTGKGHSVLEVVKRAREVTGQGIPVDWQPPRPGDPAELVADVTLMKETLNWSPQRSLEQMIQDDWNFRRGKLK